MKLENLNREKFTKLNREQMGKLVGGECQCYTKSGETIIDGAKISSDYVIERWDDNGKFLGRATAWREGGGDLSSVQSTQIIKGLEKC